MSSPNPGSGQGQLDEDRIQTLVQHAGLAWQDIAVVTETGSTNVDLAARAKAGDVAEGAAEVAGSQSAGKGRLGREWESPPGGSLSFSVALAPPQAVMPFASITLALAASSAVEALTGVGVSLKWPNDLLVGDLKLGGILAERAGEFVIVGCGVNVGLPAASLTAPAATSLHDQGADVSREQLFVTILAELARLNNLWREGAYSAVGSGLLDQFRAKCVTIGQSVTIEVPDGAPLEGTASDVDELGQLVLRTVAGEQTISVGDVVHANSARD